MPRPCAEALGVTAAQAGLVIRASQAERIERSEKVPRVPSGEHLALAVAGVEGVHGGVQARFLGWRGVVEEVGLRIVDLLFSIVCLPLRTEI